MENPLVNIEYTESKREECLKEAMQLFGPLTGLSEWELGWYLTAA